MSEVEDFPRTQSDWEGISHETTVLTRQGTEAKVIISSFILIDSTELHTYDERHGLIFDIPCDGDYNLVISDCESGNPLGVASLDLVHDIPTITQIQKVQARKENPAPQGSLALNKVFAKVDHPQRDLIQGTNKLSWEEKLIDECAKLAKNEGYDRIRLISGMNSPYLFLDYSLHSAIRGYDNLVINDQSWEPISNINLKYSEDEKAIIPRIVKWIKNRKISKLSEVEDQFPNISLPGYYEKELK